MSNYVNDLNDLITAKSEIKNIIQDTLNENPSEVFSYYPSYIARIAANAGADEETINSYISAYLSTYNFIDQDTLSANSYITLQDIPGVDLSSYVTYAYLESKQYITQSDISGLVDNMYIEEDVGESETITVSLKDVLEESGIISQTTDGYDVKEITIVAEEVVDGILVAASYITSGDVSQMGYITMADVSACGYVTASDIPSVVVPVVDENLIPKENNTYTLGDSTYQYASVNTYSVGAYNSNMYIDNAHGIGFNINGSNRIYIGNSQFRPLTDNLMNLGLSSAHFKNTYSYNYYTGFNTALTSNSDYNLQFSINGAVRFGMDTANFFPNGNANKNLGTTANQWASTYTSYLYSGNLVLSDGYNSIDNSSNTRINFKINQNNRFKMTNVEFAPVNNNGVNLGTSTEQFSKAYIGTVYVNGTDIKTMINNMFSYDSTTGTLTITSLT